MVARKLERQVNLLLCLLSTRRYLTVAEIGSMVDGYDPGDTETEAEAFRRMFERDKEDLRALGVPLETGRTSVWSEEVGYRVSRSDYALPEISLDPQEAAALSLALQMWDSGELADAARSAQLKLQAAGVDTVPPPAGLQARLPPPDPRFADVVGLLGAGGSAAVRFSYSGSGGSAPQPRRVDAWGLVSWRGRWYLVGHDGDRGAPRAFRLDRVVGPVTRAPGGVTVPRPAGLDLRSLVREPDTSGEAVVDLRPGHGWRLRRRALDPAIAPGPAPVPSAAGAPGAETAPVESGAQGWERIRVRGEAAQLAGMVRELGADARAVAPAELVAAVVAGLRAVVEAHR